MAKATISTDLSLDTTRFQRGMAMAQNRVKVFAANAIRSFGALAGAAGMGMLSRAAIDLGSRISDMSIQLRIGGEALQVLQFQAQEAGVKTQLLERALRNVNTRTQEAINGNKRYNEAFQRLKINLNTFINLPTERKLEMLAAAQAKATDKASAYNDIAIILGERAGPALQEVLQKLASEGFDRLGDAARDAGQVMSDELVQKLDEAADRIEKAKKRATVLWGEILVKLIPVFSILVNSVKAVGIILADAGKIFIAFGATLGKVVEGAIYPVIEAFKTLGEVAGATFEAIKTRNFSKFKEVITASKKGISELVENIKAIPEKTEQAFDDLKIKADKIKNETSEAGKAAAKTIREDFKGLFGLLDELGNKAKDFMGGDKPLGGDGAPGESRSGSLDRVSPNPEAKLRTPAKGIRFERVSLGGGEFTNQRFFNGRKAGRFNDEQLVNAAMGPKGKDESDEKAEERTKYLKNIDDLLKQLNGALKGG